jgi:hypothetical protein
MPYQTVFEITSKPFEWWFPAFGLIFIVVGVVFIKFGPKLDRNKNGRSFGLAFTIPLRPLGWFFVIFASFWTLVAFGSTYSSYRELEQAYRTGKYSVVEGIVENFHPMPYEGHQNECFRVEKEKFCYSDYELSPAFNQSASHGGPIRAGLPVRISYYENEKFHAQILRLEIRADSLSSAAERSAYSKTEEQKWQRTAADDPRNQAMMLGFLMAGFAWTLWWNIDWQRFIKFYGVSGPPYRRWIEVAFRGFFALCSLGAGRELLRELLERSRPAHFYRDAFLIAGLWSIAIVLMVKVVEWFSNRRKKVPASQ